MIALFALFAYRVVLILLFPVILLLLLIRSKSNPQYRQKLSERFGLFPKPAKSGGIIVHAASVGEVLALRGFIEHLLVQYTHLPITITTFTPTGAEQVKKLFGDRVQRGYLPLDILPFTSIFLRRLKPKLIIFMETELWPNLISQCANQNIKLLLINGRLSDNSMKSYKKLSALIKPALNNFDNILTQSHDNEINFLNIGANKNKCSVSGNLKFDIKVDNSVIEKQKELKQFLPCERPIWLLASSHEGDENIILDAFDRILKSQPTLLLILVPRHPERFNHVEQLILATHYSYQKRSDNTIFQNKTDIILGDSMGEMLLWYASANIAFIGGSLVKTGGHNPLEATALGIPVVSGHYVFNFSDIYPALCDAKIAWVEKTPEAITQRIIKLLANNNVFNDQQPNEFMQLHKGVVDKLSLQIRKYL